MERPQTPGRLMCALQSEELHHYKQPDLFLSYANRHNIIFQEEYLEQGTQGKEEEEVEVIYEALKKEREHQEMLEKRGDENIKATIASWSENRSRLDVEIQRKIESSMYSHGNCHIGSTSPPHTPSRAAVEINNARLLSLHESLELKSPYTDLITPMEYEKYNIVPRNIASPGFFDLSMACMERTVSNKQNLMCIGIKEQQRGECEKLKQKLTHQGISHPNFLERALITPTPRSTEECRKSFSPQKMDQRYPQKLNHKVVGYKNVKYNQRPATAPQ